MAAVPCGDTGYLAGRLLSPPQAGVSSSGTIRYPREVSVTVVALRGRCLGPLRGTLHPSRLDHLRFLYTRMNRWSKNRVLDRVFEQLQHAQIVRIKIEAVGLEERAVDR